MNWTDFPMTITSMKTMVEILQRQRNWRQNQRGWWYEYAGGGYPKNEWKQINNAWYYFNWEGYMLTGWQNINNNWYYLSGSGAMLTGWQYINNNWYYLDGSGVMLTDGSILTETGITWTAAVRCSQLPDTGRLLCKCIRSKG